MSADRDPRLWSVVLEQAGGGMVTVQHLCAAIATLTGADGAAAALATSATLRETVYAADDIAAGLEELTLTLGEGPGVDAVRSGAPVMVGDLAGPEAESRWPVFAPAAVSSGARAVFVLPLCLGAIRLGVLTLYRRSSGDLSQGQAADALALADVVCLYLLDRTNSGSEAASDWAVERNEVRQPEVHQATGMIIAQLGVSAEIAFDRLRAHAFAHNRGLGDVARDVVARRLRFLPDSGETYADPD